MQVTNDPSTIVSLKGVPVQPTTPFPPSSIADAGSTEKRGRQDSGRNPSGSPSRFRSVLDAATVAGLGQQATATESPSGGVTQPQTEFTRSGSPQRDINGQDSEALYRAMRAYSANTAKDDVSSKNDAASEDDTAAEPVFSHVALSASKRYAAAFFALDRTFAARGETLEVST